MVSIGVCNWRKSAILMVLFVAPLLMTGWASLKSLNAPTAAMVTRLALVDVKPDTIPTFPAAKGHGAGAFTAGATNVYDSVIAEVWPLNIWHVTSLSDGANPGTLIAAVDSACAAANNDALNVVVFDVAGIVTGWSSNDGLISNCQNLWIAGQTAPGGGALINGPILFRGNNTTHDIVVMFTTWKYGAWGSRNLHFTDGDRLLIYQNIFALASVNSGHALTIVSDTSLSQHGIMEGVTVQGNQFYWPFKEEPTLLRISGATNGINENELHWMTMYRNVMLDARGDRVPTGGCDSGEPCQLFENVLFRDGGSSSQQGMTFNVVGTDHELINNWIEEGDPQFAGPGRPFTTLGADSAGRIVMAGNKTEWDLPTAFDGDATPYRDTGAGDSLQIDGRGQREIDLSVTSSDTSATSQISVAAITFTLMDSAHAALVADLSGARLALLPDGTLSDTSASGHTRRDTMSQNRIDAFHNRTSAGTDWVERDTTDLGNNRYYIGSDTFDLDDQAPVAGSPPTDTDGDGLPDLAELRYTSGASTTSYSATGDVDGDGYPAIVEWLMGLDPNVSEWTSFVATFWGSVGKEDSAIAVYRVVLDTAYRVRTTRTDTLFLPDTTNLDKSESFLTCKKSGALVAIIATPDTNSAWTVLDSAAVQDSLAAWALSEVGCTSAANLRAAIAAVGLVP